MDVIREIAIGVLLIITEVVVLLLLEKYQKDKENKEPQ